MDGPETLKCVPYMGRMEHGCMKVVAGNQGQTDGRMKGVRRRWMRAGGDGRMKTAGMSTMAGGGGGGGSCGRGAFWERG